MCVVVGCGMGNSRSNLHDIVVQSSLKTHYFNDSKSVKLSRHNRVTSHENTPQQLRSKSVNQTKKHTQFRDIEKLYAMSH